MRDYNAAPEPQEPGGVEPRAEQRVGSRAEPYTEPRVGSRAEPYAEQRVGSRGELAGMTVANPAPLGLNVLAFATAVLGCFYTGFIIPYQALVMRPAVGGVLLISGIVLVIAGILEYRKNSMLSATIFTAYGAFLAVIGLVFLPNAGILGFLLSSRSISFALGLFFLCWAIFNAILFLGSAGVNLLLTGTMLILFLGYVALTVGQLAGNNTVANMIGGWLLIVAALAAWVTSLASLLGSEGTATRFSLPVRGRGISAVD
ncbi:MAG TPA: acetate uptake transporter [Ktedonobacteraceae bacterium]|nr:acetate uptake transporter [Ktedonobacteraceae bacterium]